MTYAKRGYNIDYIGMNLAEKMNFDITNIVSHLSSVSLCMYAVHAGSHAYCAYLVYFKIDIPKISFTAIAYSQGYWMKSPLRANCD